VKEENESERENLT